MQIAKMKKEYVMTMMYNDDDVLRYMYNYLCTCSAAATTVVFTNPRGLEKVTTSIPRFYMYLLYDTYQQRLKKRYKRPGSWDYCPQWYLPTVRGVCIYLQVHLPMLWNLCY